MAAKTKIRSRLIEGLERAIAKLEAQKLPRRPKCGACQSTGTHTTYDQCGNAERESQCQHCDTDWYNAHISVDQDKLRFQIEVIKKAHKEALASVGRK